MINPTWWKRSLTLRADVNNGILVKLSEFLKLPEVVEAGITLEEARKRITPAPIHMVSNINSKSSPVRMVITPHQPHKVTKQSINDALHAGHHGLPSIQDQYYFFLLTATKAFWRIALLQDGHYKIAAQPVHSLLQFDTSFLQCSQFTFTPLLLLNFHYMMTLLQNNYLRI